MSTKITSLSNPRIQEVVRLRERDARDQTGLTIVEGMREISLALKARAAFHELYVCPSVIKEKAVNILLEKLIKNDLTVFEVPEKVYAKISYGDRNDGLLAVVKPIKYALSDLKPGRGLYVVVEKVEKPGNLGAILRSCDAAGVDGVIICDGRTDLYNPNVIRGSLGTIFSLKAAVSSAQDAVNFLKSKSVKICAASPKAGTIYTKADFKQPVAIVVGSEQDGLSDFWLKVADIKIKIPMLGMADSLNVSASTAVLLYEVIRQRNFK